MGGTISRIFRRKPEDEHKPKVKKPRRFGSLRRQRSDEHAGARVTRSSTMPPRTQRNEQGEMQEAPNMREVTAEQRLQQQREILADAMDSNELSPEATTHEIIKPVHLIKTEQMKRDFLNRTSPDPHDLRQTIPETIPVEGVSLESALSSSNKPEEVQPQEATQITQEANEHILAESQEVVSQQPIVESSLDHEVAETTPAFFEKSQAEQMERNITEDVSTNEKIETSEQISSHSDEFEIIPKEDVESKEEPNVIEAKEEEVVNDTNDTNEEEPANQENSLQSNELIEKVDGGMIQSEPEAMMKAHEDAEEISQENVGEQQMEETPEVEVNHSEPDAMQEEIGDDVPVESAELEAEISTEPAELTDDSKQVDEAETIDQEEHTEKTIEHETDEAGQPLKESELQPTDKVSEVQEPSDPYYEKSTEEPTETMAETCTDEYVPSESNDPSTLEVLETSAEPHDETNKEIEHHIETSHEPEYSSEHTKHEAPSAHEHVSEEVENEEKEQAETIVNQNAQEAEHVSGENDHLENNNVENSEVNEEDIQQQVAESGISEVDNNIDSEETVESLQTEEKHDHPNIEENQEFVLNLMQHANGSEQLSPENKVHENEEPNPDFQPEEEGFSNEKEGDAMNGEDKNEGETNPINSDECSFMKDEQPDEYAVPAKSATMEFEHPEAQNGVEVNGTQESM